MGATDNEFEQDNTYAKDMDLRLECRPANIELTDLGIVITEIIPSSNGYKGVA